MLQESNGEDEGLRVVIKPVQVGGSCLHHCPLDVLYLKRSQLENRSLILTFEEILAV